MAGLPVQQAITAAEAINQLFATGSGTVAGTADALNSINGAVGASNLSATQILNGIGATAGITNVGATSVNMFQQFAADSAEAGVLASKVAGVAAVVGLFSNVGLIYTQSTDSKGIQTNTVISTIGSALGVLALTAAAPEVALALGVAAAGLTLYGLKDQGSLAQTVANLQSVIAPYFNSLSPANQSAFTATFSQTTQSVLSGGMLVPTVDNNGMISGYSVQIPTSVVTQTDGSTVSYFSGNVAYVQQPAAGSNAVSSASGSQLQGEWTIPQANNGTAQINTYADGSYTQSAVDAKGNQVSLQSNAATPGVLSIETSGTSTSGSKIDQNETLQINSNSSKTDDLKNLNGNGTIQNEQVITTQANGQASAILSGTGAATTLSNAAVTISAGSTASVIGNGNTISVGTGGTLTVTSSGNGLANTVNVSTGTVTNVSANTDVNFHSTQGSNVVNGTGAGAVINDVSAGNNTINMQTAGQTVGVNTVGVETVNASTQDTTYVSGTSYVNFHSSQGNNTVTGVASGAVINDVSAGNNTINMQTAGQTVGVNTVGVETVNASTQDTTYVSGTSYVNFHSSQGNNTVTGVASGAVINDVSAGNNTINMQTAGQTVGVNTVGVETVNASTQDTTYVSGTSYV
ncbi:beta strand repeat-containing protein, partial [Collimonas fungivorans]|uniref:beta strand repeat-containing protein n=1 Tax=Collimonas fungivorans TaxID=158899 RepID=UPI003FA3A6F8